MKRKVVVTMSLAWWSDDKYWEGEDINSNADVVALLERDCTESDYMEFADEATTIKVEITETKE